jgi:hypothetical protein
MFQYGGATNSYAYVNAGSFNEMEATACFDSQTRSIRQNMASAQDLKDSTKMDDHKRYVPTTADFEYANNANPYPTNIRNTQHQEGALLFRAAAQPPVVDHRSEVLFMDSEQRHQYILKRGDARRKNTYSNHHY